MSAMQTDQILLPPRQILAARRVTELECCANQDPSVLRPRNLPKHRHQSLLALARHFDQDSVVMSADSRASCDRCVADQFAKERSKPMRSAQQPRSATSTLMLAPLRTPYEASVSSSCMRECAKKRLM